MLFDAAIVGGGLVGSGMALALADAGYKVQLLDAGPAVQQLSEEPDLRVVALSKASLDWLKHIQVFSQLQSERIGKFQKVAVYENDGTLVFDADEIPLDYLGIIVENKHVLHKLHQRALNHNNIQAQFSHSINNINELNAQLIIGADGANSWLRKQLGITVQSKDYEQRAWVCYVETQKPHKYTAWQRFLPGGPIAFLPTREQNKSSIVWTLPADETPDISAQIKEATADYFGDIKVVSKIASFPLRMQHAHEYGREGCILLGDAIHSIHPLAGQGVNLGFADAQALFTLLNSTDPKHWGKDLIRQKFERNRRPHNTLIAQSMSAFLKTSLRNSGIRLFKRSQHLKKMAMQVALS